MSSILSIAASGMAAASQRLQVSAENIANAESDGPLPSAGAAVQSQYAPSLCAAAGRSGGDAGRRHRRRRRRRAAATVAAYAPTAPYADANGEVATPNVDYANEAIQQATAAYDFAMNAQVMRVYSQMTKTLLDVQA